MTTVRVSLAMVLGVLVPVTLLSSAEAQETNRRATGSSALEEIVVTAQKREQSMQDVAISVTAYSGTDLERLQIENFDDLVEIVPGVSTDSPNTNVFNRAIGIRGIQSQSGTTLAAENTVGFYINNIPISITNPRLVDLQRAEVLRGPQGTLYGASSLAGLMKLVTRKPGFESFAGHVRGESNFVKDGEWGSDLEASVNIPINDAFAIRASGYLEDRPGYIDARPVDLSGSVATGSDVEDYNEIRSTGGRIAAYWQATPDLTAYLSFMANDLKSDGSGMEDDFAPSLSADGPVTLFRFPTVSNNDDNLTSLEIEWDLESFQIQSSTGIFNQYRETVNNDMTDLLGLISTPAQEIRGTWFFKRDEFVQEVRLLSNLDSAFEYIVGAFYSERSLDYNTVFPAEPGSSLFGVPNPPSDLAFASHADKQIEEQALFGELYYDFSEQWSATIGVRAFKFDTAFETTFVGNPILVAGGEAHLAGGSDVDDIVPKVSLEYRSGEDLMLYATAAEGFRAGGSNSPRPNSPECRAELQDRIGQPTIPPGYDPDSVWNYELGLKSTVANGRVRMSAAVYQMNWTDIQVQVAPLCGLSDTVLNAGKARSQGFEYELNAALADDFTVALGASYIDAEFTEDVTFGGSFIFASEGSRIPDIPEWSGNLRALYDFRITDTFDGFLRGTLTYRGDRVASTTVTAQGRVKESYSVLNMILGARNENWTFTLFGENLTDSRPSFVGLPLRTESGPFGPPIGGVPIDYSLRPRTYGFAVRYDFY